MSGTGNFETKRANVAEQAIEEEAAIEPGPFAGPATTDPEVPEADALEQAQEVLDDEEADPR